MSTGFAWIGGISAVFVLVWALAANGLIMTRYFAPRYEQVRRETFEQSKAYNQGVIQELQNMQFQYVQSEPEHRAALASVILRRAADYDADKLPADLGVFIRQLRRERTGGVR